MVPEIGVASVGRSVCVSGELTGSEDLTVEGRVEGRIHLPDHTVTIGPNATIRAEIVAKVVTIFGSVVGNIKAHEIVHVRHGATLEGNLKCPRIAMQDRAHFCGTVDMPTRSDSRREVTAETVTA